MRVSRRDQAELATFILRTHARADVRTNGTYERKHGYTGSEARAAKKRSTGASRPSTSRARLNVRPSVALHSNTHTHIHDPTEPTSTLKTCSRSLLRIATHVLSPPLLVRIRAARLAVGDGASPLSLASRPLSLSSTSPIRRPSVALLSPSILTSRSDQAG